MFFSVDPEPDDLGSKDRLDSRYRSGKCDLSPAARDAVDPEALTLKPARDLCNITGCKSEAIGKLLGGQPFVVLARSRVLLRRDELL
jgi:hypothetical protein